MPSIISQFSPAQLELLGVRARSVLKQAESSTGVLVQGDNPGECYLDDVNALFLTNDVGSGDIVQITAGLDVPYGEYSIAGPYYDPRVPANDQLQDEHRIILDGYPLLGGPVTYTVYSASEIMDELSAATLNKTYLENFRKQQLLDLDALFLVFLTKFDVINNYVASTHAYLAGTDRTRVTGLGVTLLDDSAVATNFTELFPEDYYELSPNRTSTSYPSHPNPIDVFTLTWANSELEGTVDEAAEDALIPSGSPLTAPYLAALTTEEDALDLQDANLVLIQAEIADNNSVAEAGDLYTYYTAMSTLVQAHIDSVALRLADIAAIRTSNRTRTDPANTGLNFPTYTGLTDGVQTEINSRAAELAASPFSDFLDLRFPYIDAIVNRAYGTRSELVSNIDQVTMEEARRQALFAELATDNDLLAGVP